MFRPVLFVLFLPACAFIGSKEHDERLDEAVVGDDDDDDDDDDDAGDLNLDIIGVDPELLSLCGGMTVTAELEVDEAFAGDDFDVLYAVDGGSFEEAGSATADDGFQGRSTFAVSFDIDADCAGPDACSISLDLGVTNGEADATETFDQLLVLPDAVPAITEAVFVADDDTTTSPVDQITLAANPLDSVAVYDWPTLEVALDDVYTAHGAAVDLQGAVYVCPDGVDPSIDDSQCANTPAEPGSLALSSDVGFTADLAEFGVAGCADPTTRWRIWMLVGEHPCGGAFYDLNTPALRLVHEDCDGDTEPAATDCDDDDDTIQDGLFFYEDDDEDGVGDVEVFACTQPSGTVSVGGDCDDADDRISPALPEICDGLDNDCDGTTPEDGMLAVDGAAHVGTLQGAIDVGGSVVDICGTHLGVFTVTSSMSLIGHDAILDGSGGGDAGAVITVTGDIDVGVFDLEIRGGTGWASSDTEYWGGGIYADSEADLLVETSDIHDNNADFGGGIYATTLTLIDVDIHDNTSDVDGGGVFLAATGTLDMTDGALRENTSAGNSGGLGIDHATATLSGTAEIHDNSAMNFGGGVGMDSGVLIGGTVRDNTAQDGGGIAATTSGATASELVDVIVRANIATEDAGGASCDICPAGFEVTRGEFDRNIAGDDSGGLQLGFGGGSIENTVFVGNSATEDGGGLRVMASGSLTISGAIFDGNSADNGAGIHFSDAFASLDNVTLRDNLAGNAGAGISIGTDQDGNSNIGIVNSLFERNIADNNGGGLDAFGSAVVTITNTDFFDNQADAGGAFYASSAVTIANSRLEGNDADSGGAIAIGTGLVTVNNCELAFNTAITGGAVLLSLNSGVNGSIEFIGGAVIANNASAQGGAVFLANGTLDSTGTFWGSVPPPLDENTPNDIYVDPQNSFWNYNAPGGDTFMCSPAGCTSI